jgi:hypothetical protein
MKEIRKPSVAGTFYKADPDKLKEEIQLLLSISQPAKIPENIIGLISPHAGYIYSGRTAAYAFNLIKNRPYKKIIIISPSHREYFPGISIYSGDGYETPLGVVPIDKEMTDALVGDSPIIFKGVQGHRQEHAVEVQIPFLQTVLKDFSIVPVVMGDQSKIFIDELADRLKAIVDEETLILSSSDLSHYHSKKDAYILDSVVEKRIMEFDFNRLRFELEEGVCEACGGGPIVAMMRAAFELNKRSSMILFRSDSGDTTGDNSEVVGYLSAAIYGE